MGNKPKISCVIPCYNQSQFLAECIESVLAQTYKPHEIIICNDGSQDDTRYVAMQYPEVKYIEQVNKGLASARNTGIMNMTGDWFFPLDSDDKMLPNCLKVVADTIENNPDADIVAPSFRCFGKHEGEVILMPNPTLEDFKPADFKTPMNRVGYFSAIKKEALLEIGGYSPRMTWGWEDLHLWINLLSKGKKIVTIPEVLVLYRTKEESMITEANKHASELMTQIYKDFPSIK